MRNQLPQAHTLMCHPPAALQLPSCSFEESWSLPAGIDEQHQAETAPAAQQQHWAIASSAVAQLSASTPQQKKPTAWQPAAAAAATRDALAPLLQQPKVELAAGSTICSPTALTAEQFVSRAARLEALVKSCSGSGVVVAASAQLSLLPQQEMLPVCSSQQGWTASSCMLGSSSSTAGATGTGRIAACAGSGEDAAAGSVTDHASPAAEAAAAAVPAASLSCQSSLQADLAVAFDKDARLHSLLASSRSSIYSRRNSTAETAPTLGVADYAGAAAVDEAEPHCLMKDQRAAAAAGGCGVDAGDGSSLAAAAGRDMYKAAELTAGEQRAESANQPADQQQQLDLVLSDAAVQLMLQEAPAAETASLQPAAAAAVAAADLLSGVLRDKSSTASLAAFEQEIAAMLSQSGAAEDSKSRSAWQ
jgi:hypothetical protein